MEEGDAAIKREGHNLTSGDELPQTGVIRWPSLYRQKRKLVGDKMAGRHGNKGYRGPCRARRGYAVPRGRYDRRYLPEPAGCAFAYEPQ